MDIHIISCPAIQKRNPGYPFGDRVPRRIRMLKTVVPDLSHFFPEIKHPIARAGAEFRAWTNSNGAVIAVFPNGDKLGVKPGEFEVIDWLDVKEVLM